MEQLSSAAHMEGETLLVLTAWGPPQDYIDHLKTVSPGIRVIIHLCPIHRATEVPEDISSDVWNSVTVLLTWKIFPPKGLAPKLKYVQLISAGSNHVLGLPLFEETDATFCTASGVHPPQITEWVFATFLSFQHHLPEYLENQKIGKWVYPETDETTEDAVGLRVGILGYGRIGRQCARVAKAFGMDVYAYNLRERPTVESRRDESFTEPGLGDPEGLFPSKWFHGPEQLNSFLGSDLDLLIITLPGTPATQGMVSLEQFRILSKRKAFISNVGRGSVINTDDLMTALDEGLVRGAAVDVTDPEPLPESHKLWTYKNVIITPHCSGTSAKLLPSGDLSRRFLIQGGAKGTGFEDQNGKITTASSTPFLNQRNVSTCGPSRNVSTTLQVTTGGTPTKGDTASSAIANLQSLQSGIPTQSTCSTTQLFVNVSNTVVGLYVVKLIQGNGLGDSLVSQVCSTGLDGGHIMGAAVNTAGDLNFVQAVIQGWFDGNCFRGLDNERSSQNITIPEFLTGNSTNRGPTSTSSNIASSSNPVSISTGSSFLPISISSNPASTNVASTNTYSSIPPISTNPFSSIPASNVSISIHTTFISIPIHTSSSNLASSTAGSSILPIPTNPISSTSASNNPTSSNPASSNPASINQASTDKASINTASTNTGSSIPPISTNPISSIPASTNTTSTNLGSNIPPISTNPTSSIPASNVSVPATIVSSIPTISTQPNFSLSFTTLAIPSSTTPLALSCPLGNPDSGSCYWVCDYFVEGNCQLSIAYNQALGNPLLPPPSQAALSAVANSILTGSQCGGSGKQVTSAGNALSFTVCLVQAGNDCPV
ncbi:hypothetical protein B7463_g6217, partial [Scytalidium lignicola]